nr:uncharacterized protein si:ch211-176l24.4 [Nothobranchius furzeri]
MSDFEDAAFYFESFTSPKPKRKKQAKKDRKEPKPKKSESIKAQEGVHSKLRETTKELKEKKKEKRKNKNKEKRKMKKKKNKLAPELEDFTLTQFSSTQAKRSEKLEIPGKSKDSMKEGKRNKMVAFDSLPTYIRVKRPQFASSTPKETEDVRRNESCSQVSSTGQTQDEAQDDVQWTSDDVNSQDLFITQKTFRTSPAKAFSGVASDEFITASPQVFTQKNKSQKTAEEINKTLEITHKCPQEGAVLKLKQEKISSQTHKLKPSLAQQKKAEAPKWMNPFLDEPVVISETPEERSSSALPHGEPSLPRPRSANSSTQTENFFTSELSSYLHFCQKSRAAACVEDLKPLDLSLPQRVRKDLRLSVKMSVINAKLDLGKPVLRGEMSDDGSKGVSEKLREKPAEVKKEPETTPSPQSEFDTKSADTTASSEDDHLARSAKKDLSQVGAVQLRLNKPFFFKTKGEWQSPRPESPLTKFSQGRNPKSKKCH